MNLYNFFLAAGVEGYENAKGTLLNLYKTDLDTSIWKYLDDKNQREKHYCYYIIQIYLKRFDAHSKRHPQLKNLKFFEKISEKSDFLTEDDVWNERRNVLNKSE